MALDIKKHREKVKQTGPELNLVPLIDILFVLLIFLAVTSNFQAVEDSSSGKPDSTDSQGNAEYYLLPVSGLHTVTVDGKNMSHLIKDSSIAVHTDVIDNGEILIKPKKGIIDIKTPKGMTPEKAVMRPQSI